MQAMESWVPGPAVSTHRENVQQSWKQSQWFCSPATSFPLTSVSSAQSFGNVQCDHTFPGPMAVTCVPMCVRTVTDCLSATQVFSLFVLKPHCRELKSLLWFLAASYNPDIPYNIDGSFKRTFCLILIFLAWLLASGETQMCYLHLGQVKEKRSEKPILKIQHCR